MEITEVRIAPSDDKRIAAFASIVLDDCFVVHGLRVQISKTGDYFLFMPGRKQADGNYIDIAFPLNSETRQMLEEKVFAAYRIFADEPVKTRL